MDAILIYNFAKKENEAFRVQLESYLEEGKRIGIHFIPKDNVEAIDYVGLHFSSLSFALLLDYDLATAAALEAFDLPLFNNVSTLLFTHDAELLNLALASERLPMRRFYAAPDLGGNLYANAFEFLEKEIEARGIRYPYRIKPRFGDPEDPGTLVLNPLGFHGYLAKQGFTPFVVYEEVVGPHFVGYVANKKCLCILEKSLPKKAGGPELLSLSSIDNRFNRSLCYKAVQAVGCPAAMVELVMMGDTPLVTNVTPFIRTVAAEHLTHLPMMNNVLLYLKRNYRKKGYYESAELRRRHKRIRQSVAILAERNPKD